MSLILGGDPGRLEGGWEPIEGTADTEEGAAGEGAGMEGVGFMLVDKGSESRVGSCVGDRLKTGVRVI